MDLIFRTKNLNDLFLPNESYFQEDMLSSSEEEEEEEEEEEVGG